MPAVAALEGQIDNCVIPESLREIQWVTFDSEGGGWKQLFQSLTEGIQRRSVA